MVDRLVLFLLVAIAFCAVGSILVPFILIQFEVGPPFREPLDVVPQQQQQQSARAHTQQRVLSTFTLENEEEFRKTVKECIPNLSDDQKCKRFVPDPIGDDDIASTKKKVERVALISPPGTYLSNDVYEQIYRIQQQQQGRQNSNTTTEFRAFETTHVPPYGYGKTHGLTKIIRPIPVSILQQVIDSLLTVSTSTPITLNDLRMGTRQILRFHCRLSHVAAHTSMLSIQPQHHTIQDLLNFLILEPPALVEEFAAALQNTNDGTTTTMKDTIVSSSSVEEMSTIVQHHLESITISEGVHNSSNSTSQQRIEYILHELALIVADEMKKSDSMKKWPCLSFYGSTDAETRLLSNRTLELAKQLSPDCSTDPYNHCWVGRDWCEYYQDSKCTDSKNKKKH